VSFPHTPATGATPTRAELSPRSAPAMGLCGRTSATLVWFRRWAGGTLLNPRSRQKIRQLHRVVFGLRLPRHRLLQASHASADTFPGGMQVIPIRPFGPGGGTARRRRSHTGTEAACVGDVEAGAERRVGRQRLRRLRPSYVWARLTTRREPLEPLQIAEGDQARQERALNELKPLSVLR